MKAVISLLGKSRFLFWAFTLILLSSSCSQERDYLYFCFSSVGGPIEYNADIDGSSISIECDGVFSRKAEFYEDCADESESQWFAELDWIRVYYTPSRQHLQFYVDRNPTGKKRMAYITANQKNKKIKIAEIKQEK